MYVEAIYRLGNTMSRIYPADARRMIAAALLGKETDPLLFGRDSDGKTLGTRVNRASPLAAVVYDGGKGFVRVYGVGWAGKKVVTQEMGKIASALGEANNSAISVDIKQGKLAFKPAFCIYRIAKLAIAKPDKVRGDKFFTLVKKFKAATTEERPSILQEATPMILEIIEKGLVGTAAQIGEIDIPANLHLVIHEGELSVDKMLGKTVHVGIVRNLRFSMVGNLVGPWSVGLLRSHGYGLIRREIEK